MVQRIAYGFRSDLPTFAGLSPAACGARLRDLGCDAVFMSNPDAAWSAAFHTCGLRLFVEVGLFVGEEVWEQFPGSRPIQADGTPAPREEWYEPAIPTLPTLRAQRLDAIERLAQMAPIDGVWLDFIRWPARWERPQPRLYDSSFDLLTLQQFQADRKIHLPSLEPATASAWILEHAAAEWFDWRCSVIDSFAAEARARLRRWQPDALLGAFTVPWTDADYDGAFVRVLGQDPARLASYIDVFSPMVYHRLCGRDVAWIEEVTRWVRARSGRPTWPIVEAIAPAEEYPATELAAACQTAAQASGEAVIVFTLEGMLQDPARLTAWRS